MSGFVSSPPAAAAAPEAVIEHDGFFPGVKLSSVRAAQRIPSQVTDVRLRDAILAAMLTVDAELSSWRQAQISAGNLTLAAVSDRQLAGEPRLVRLYHRAVGSFVAAELADTHHDIGATGDGQKRIQEIALSSDEHRRNGTHAVRDILGATRAAVELI